MILLTSPLHRNGCLPAGRQGKATSERPWKGKRRKCEELKVTNHDSFTLEHHEEHGEELLVLLAAQKYKEIFSRQKRSRVKT